jgi:hypothetical protein
MWRETNLQVEDALAAPLPCRRPIKCFPFLSTGGQAKWREPNRRGFSGETAQPVETLVGNEFVSTRMVVGV